MKPRMRFNLRTRYSVQILLVILASMVGLSLLSLWQLRTTASEVEQITSSALQAHLEQQVRERGLVMTEFLAQNLTRAVLTVDLRTMRDELAKTTAQRDVIFAYLYDEQGRIVHDGSPSIESYGEPLVSKLGWQLTPGEAPQIRMVNGRLHLARPIIVADEYRGGVAVGLSLDIVAAETAGLSNDLNDLARQRLRKELIYTSVVILLFLLGGALLALVTGRRLARPIRDLANQARRLGEGNFDPVVKVGRNDEIGDLAKAFRSMQDNLANSQQAIQHLAFHDPLTGLPNRANLVDDLESMCAGSRPGSLLFIDLDDFKPVNDSLGHEAGDDLLVATAARLQESVRLAVSEYPSGSGVNFSVARLGGDEFTVLLKGTADQQLASNVASAILEALTQPFEIKGHELFIGASVGIAGFPDDGDNAEALFARADVAMYHAKRTGKQAFCFYQPFMLDETRSKLFLINDLRAALERNDFTVHYQPIIAASSGNIIGAEALVRWNHPQRGLIKAAEFIDVAEKSGEIERLGRWALEQVCRDMAAWRDAGLEGLFVSINISSRQLLRADLPDLVTGMLSQWGHLPRDLRIEASEHRVLAQTDEVAGVLRKWNEAGFEIWIDHFGSGTTSLVNLRQVPARGIKLDPRFLRDMSNNERLRKFINAILDMARTMDLEVCAVGVSSSAQAQWLKERGCRFLQGRWLGPELGARELAEYLARDSQDNTLGAQSNSRAI